MTDPKETPVSWIEIVVVLSLLAWLVAEAVLGGLRCGRERKGASD